MERTRVTSSYLQQASRWIARALTCLLLGAVFPAQIQSADSSTPRSSVIVVVGAPGEKAYQEMFQEWADRWKSASTQGSNVFLQIGGTEAHTNSLVELKEALKREPNEGFGDLWLIFIGHGTFDGKEARFNLAGDDLSPSELNALLDPIQRRVAVVFCSSASSPFLPVLSKPGRSLITATRSGQEQNFTRLGDALSTAVGSLDADLDKDGQTSLLEAWLFAARATEDFYKNQGRLATEHSLLDDNGDKLGTQPDWFRGVRAVRKAKDGAEADGLRAQQFTLIPNATDRQLSLEARQKRDSLELQIAQLRDEKNSLAEPDYYAKLEPLLLELARLYRDAGQQPPSSSK